MIVSPLEKGYGNRHIALNKDKRTMTMIIMLQYTNDVGMSPISLRTFSDRSSDLSCVLFALLI